MNTLLGFRRLSLLLQDNLLNQVMDSNMILDIKKLDNKILDNKIIDIKILLR